MSTEWFSLSSATDKWMTRDRLYGGGRDPSHDWPSSASAEFVQDGVRVVVGTCMRQSYYDISDGKRSHDIRARWYFEQGDMVEEALGKQWAQMGSWVDSQVRVFHQERCISGALDFILRANGCDFGVEVKSFDSSNYRARASLMGNKSRKSMPRDSHLLQVMIYCDLLPELPYIKIYYQARSGDGSAEFDVKLARNPKDGRRYAAIRRSGSKFEPDLRFCLDTIYERFEKRRAVIASGVTPERDYSYRYDPERVEDLNRIGRIWSNDYKKWKESNGETRLGDWQCSLCSHRSKCMGEQPHH